MIPIEQAIQVLKENNVTSMEEIWSTAQSTVESAYVPSVSDEMPCGENDFKDYKCTIENSFEHLKVFINSVIEYGKNETSFQIDNKLITSLLILCAEHNSLFLWSTTATVRLAQEVVNSVCQLYSFETVGEYLVDEKLHSATDKKHLKSSDRFKLVLNCLHPKLLKNTWKCYPSAVEAFKWLLFQVKFPHLNFENHCMAFTTSLIILDDFVSSNKITGINCLHHFTENITSTDFRYYGRDVVVYDALFSNLYSREPDILNSLLPCLLISLKKMNPTATTPDESITSYVYHWDKFDDVFQNIFTSMMLDEHLQLRMTYLKYLPMFMEARGLRTVLFAKQMVQLIQVYMEAEGTGSHDLIKLTLEVFLVFMKTIQVRLYAHAFDIFLVLLKKLYDFTNSNHLENEETDTVIVDLIGENLKFLIQSAPVQFSDISIEYVNSLKLNELGTSILMSACQFEPLDHKA